MRWEDYVKRCLVGLGGESERSGRVEGRRRGRPRLIWEDYDKIYLVGFNKIAIPNNNFQMASGQGSHWLIESEDQYLLP